MGSITVLVDQSGIVVQTYRYDSFGNIINSSGTITQPFTYTGREYDSETGLYYYRARYYDPKIGRFLQEDPLPDVNLYSYCGNNPINYVDPLGLRHGGVRSGICGNSVNNFWNNYLNYTSKYMINVGPYASALAVGIWHKAWVPATGGRPPLLGSKNVLTSVPSALGLPYARTAVVRGTAATIGVATMGIGYYNIGVLLGGFWYAADPYPLN